MMNKIFSLVRKKATLARLFKLLFLVAIAVAIINFSKDTFPAVALRHNDGYEPNATSETCLRNLKKNSYVIAINFDQAGNNRKSEVNLLIRTTNKAERIYIYNLYLYVGDKEIVFPINKEFKANLDVWFTKGEDDWKIDCYGDWIEVTEVPLYNKLRKYKNKFKTARCIITFSLDGSEIIMSEENNYDIFFYDREKDPPDFMYMLFPHM